MGGGGGFVENLSSKVKRVEKFWTQIDRGLGVLKIRQFLWTLYLHRPQHISHCKINGNKFQNSYFSECCH